MHALIKHNASKQDLQGMDEVKATIQLNTETAECVRTRRRPRFMYYRNAQPWSQLKDVTVENIFREDIIIL